MAATTQQAGPALRPPPDTLSIGWEFAVDAWGVRVPRDRVDAGPGCAWTQRLRLRRGHLTAQHSRQSVENTKRKRRRATRQSATNLSETMLNALASTHRFRLDEDHASLERRRYTDEESTVRQRRERSRRADDVVRKSRWLRTSATSANYEPLSTSTERVCSRRPSALEGRTAAGSDGDVGKRPPKTASLVGQICRHPACDVIRPLHETIGNVQDLQPRRHCPLPPSLPPMSGVTTQCPSSSP